MNPVTDNSQEAKFQTTHQWGGIYRTITTVPGESYMVEFETSMNPLYPANQGGGFAVKNEVNGVYEDLNGMWMNQPNLPYSFVFRAKSNQTFLAYFNGNAEGVDATFGLKRMKITTVAHYEAEILMSADYQAYGDRISDRTFMAESYRYGWNGKEAGLSDADEGVLDLGARIYNSQTGRMYSTDPREAEYAWQSTYVYFSNNPIAKIDFNGEGDEDPIPINGNVKTNIDNMKWDPTLETEEEFNNRKAEYLEIYNKIVSLINEGHADGNHHAANNLTRWLNGTGGTKEESLGWLKKFNSYKSADSKLTMYIYDRALELGETVAWGETKTFKVDGYAAALTGGMVSESDLYYSSGTSYIKANANVTISKDKDGQTTIKIIAYKSWIDTYDWNAGQGTFFVDVTDDEAMLMEPLGAGEFELRTNYIEVSTTSFFDNFWTISLAPGPKGVARSVKTLRHPEPPSPSEIEYELFR